MEGRKEHVTEHPTIRTKATIPRTNIVKLTTPPQILSALHIHRYTRETFARTAVDVNVRDMRWSRQLEGRVYCYYISTVIADGDFIGALSFER